LESETPAVELSFWRVIYRYLLSIVASLVCGAIWYFVAVAPLQLGSFRAGGFLHLGVYPLMLTGILALAVGFLGLGYVWLALDLGAPVPQGVDEQARNYELFGLWLGIPLVVLVVLALFAGLALLMGNLFYGSGLHGAR
jgi:hypothetical protein